MIDPTGRTALLTNRKLARLAVLLAGVFVVGCGIGWLVSQLGGSPADTGSQRAATTLPVPVPPSPAPVQPEEAAPPPVQSAAADSVPAPSAPPSAVPQLPPAPAPASAAPPLVVIESAPVSPTPTVAPPQATPAPSEPVHHAHHNHTARGKHAGHHHRHHGHRPVSAGSVTVIGVKARTPGSRWIVQLGAFRTHDHAALLAMTLKAHGTSAKVTKSNRGAKGIWYVVQAGGAMPLKSAVATAHRIAAREGIAAYVMKPGG